MAKEDKAAQQPEQNAQQAEAPPKKKKTMLFIIIGLVVVLLLGGGAGAYFFFFAKPHDDQLEAEGAQGHSSQKAETKSASKSKGKDKKEEEKPGFMLPMDAFVVNLADPQAKHYIKVTITLELKDEKAKAEAEHVMPRLKNDIIMLLSSKTMEDVIPLEGKTRLRDEVAARAQAVLGDNLKDVYFVQLVIQ